MSVIALIAALILGQPGMLSEDAVVPSLPELVVEIEADRAEHYGIEGPDAATWARLAECESGDWLDRGADFVEGSARWDWGSPGFVYPPERTRLFYGGLQFELESYLWAVEVGGHDVPDHPAEASVNEQVEVARTLLDIHPAGWGAWPTCAGLLGLMP